MHLKLLLVILWVTTAFVESQSTINCLHDGFSYLNDSTPSCSCRKGFLGTQCETRTCFNEGQARTTSFDIGCVCAPGFLGSNCEPTKCTTGESGSFYEDNSDRMISVYITQNNGTWNETFIYNDNVMVPICNFYETNGYKGLQLAMGDGSGSQKLSKTDCFSDYVEVVGDTKEGNLVGDKSNSLNLLDVETILDATTPNSLFFLVVNYNATADSTSAVSRMVRKAISKRITIHVVVFRTPYIISDYHDYVDPNNAGYQALRILAESTLGSFITPYWGTSHTTLGPNNASEAVSALLDMKSSGYNPSAIFKTVSSPFVSINVGTEYYISIRTEDDAYFNSTTSPLQFLIGPTLTTALVDTGYWKLYNLASNVPEVQFRLNNANTLQRPVDYIIYSKNALDLYPAVTNDQTVDAVASYGHIDNTNKQLVIHNHNGDKIVDRIYAYSSAYQNTSFFNVVGSGSFQNFQNIPRDCQFNIYAGDLACSTEGAIFIQTVFNDSTWSVLPFFCVGPNTNDKLNSFSFAESVAQPEVFDMASDEECTTINEQEMKLKEEQVRRGFAIISRNVRYMDGDSTLKALPYSPVDRLYYNPGNIFDYLKTTQNIYSDYYALLVGNTESITTDNLAVQTLKDPNTDLFSFMNTVLSKTNTAESYTNETVDWNYALEFLSAKLFYYTQMYTDVFVVIDYKDDVSKILNNTKTFENIYNTRTRIYFLTVDSFGGMQPKLFGNDVNDPILQLSKAAAQTSGGLYRFPTFDDLIGMNGTTSFFDFYFGKPNSTGMIGSDVVFQRMYTTVQMTFTSDAVYLPETLTDATNTSTTVNYRIVLYGTQPAQSITSSCNVTIGLPVVFGEMRIYNLNVSTLTADTSCKFTVSYPPPQTQAVNFMIYATGVESQLPYNADVGFSDSNSTDISQKLLQYGTRGQNPVVSAAVSSFQINNSTFFNLITSTQQSSNPVRSRTGCSGYASFVDYEFFCEARDDFYYFFTTFEDTANTLHSRAYVTRCLSQVASCINGQGDNCVCNVGYDGDYCQRKVCQNGGTLQPSGNCICTPGFSGTVCEYAFASNCTNNPGFPDTRSELSSVLFVVEKTGVNLLTSAGSFPGVQFSVVEFGCDGATTKYIGTDPTKLAKTLNTAADNTMCLDSLAKTSGLAIVQALKTQLEPRALLIYITKSTYSPFGGNKTNILELLGAQRVDIRVYSGGNSDTDLARLAQYGNGIPFVTANYEGDFKPYFSSYIKNLFPASTQPINTVTRLSVIQTGPTGAVNVTVNNDGFDSTTAVVYNVHHGNETGVNVYDSNWNSLTATTSIGNIYSYTSSGAITFKITPPAGSNASYSIEKLTTTNLGYGFQNSGESERLQVGLRKGAINVMSFYTSNSLQSKGIDGNTFPYVVLNEIKDEGIEPDHRLITTRKSDNCVYTYYTDPIPCNDIKGYIAKFYTYSSRSVLRTEQKVLLCSSTSSYITDNHNGDNNSTTPPVKLPQAFAFIIDVYGGDPNLFNKTIDTIKYFLSSYPQNNVSVFFIDQTGVTVNTDFEPYTSKSIAQLFNVPFNDRTQIDVNNKTDLTKALTTITQKAPHNVANSNVFFIAQTGVLPSTSYTGSIADLEGYGFSFSTVYFLVTTGTDRSVENMKSIQENFVSAPLRAVNNTRDAVAFMNEQAGGPGPVIASTPPAPRSYSCVKNSQASIFVSIENSNRTGNGVDDAKLTQTFKEFFNYFPSDFELGDQFTYKQYPNTNYDRYGCNVDLDRFEGVTQMSGWAIGGQRISSTPDLCYSNYALVGQYLNPNQAANSIDFNYLATIFFNNTFSQTCKCTRQEDSSVLKTAVWLVYSKPNYDNNTSNTLVDSFTTANNFVHIIVGFGNAANPKEGDFYYNLAARSVEKIGNYPTADQTLKQSDFIIDGSGYDGKDLVTQVWTVICRLQSLIAPNEKARPPTQDSEQFFSRFRKAQAEGLIPYDGFQDESFV